MAAIGSAGDRGRSWHGRPCSGAVGYRRLPALGREHPAGDAGQASPVRAAPAARRPAAARSPEQASYALAARAEVPSVLVVGVCLSMCW